MLHRRQFLAAASAAAAIAPFPLLAQGAASRSFRVVRGRSEIGAQTNSVTASDGRVEARVDVEIVARLIGLPVYRYELRNREVWEDGLLVSLESTANDDGDRFSTRITRRGDALVASGNGYSGALPGDAATTSYWTPAFLQRPVWISTQTGAPLAVRSRRAGSEMAPAFGRRENAARWDVSGDIDVSLYYDARGEWIGSVFEASGERARIEAVSETGPLAALWPG